MPKRRNPTILRLVAQNAALLAPAVLILSIAVPRLQPALAVERAYPVPAYVSDNVQVPHEAYHEAAQSLALASDSDGEAQIARAEMLLLSGEPVHGLIGLTKRALGRDPSSARGWALLAALEELSNPSAAADALGLSLELAPYDYWLAGQRAARGARLWPHLTGATRQSVVRQVQLLWSEPSLRASVPALLGQAHGAELVHLALAGEPDQVRALNREILRERHEECTQQATTCLRATAP